MVETGDPTWRDLNGDPYVVVDTFKGDAPYHTIASNQQRSKYEKSVMRVVCDEMPAMWTPCLLSDWRGWPNVVHRL